MFDDYIKVAKISKHEDLNSQCWFRTTKDSKIFLSVGWRELAVEFNCFKNGKFDSKMFDIGNNGGSYQLNFDSKDLPKILKALKKLGYNIEYRNDETRKEISKKEYTEQTIRNELSRETQFLASIF